MKHLNVLKRPCVVVIVLLMITCFNSILFAIHPEHDLKKLRGKIDKQEELPIQSVVPSKSAMLGDVDGYGNVPSILSLEQVGGSAIDQFYDVVVDDAGNIYAVGEFSGKLTINGEEVVSVGDKDGILVKYNSEGDIVWYRTIPADANNYCELKSITINASGELIIAGDFIGRVEVFNETLKNEDYNQAFILNCDADGNKNWVVKVWGAQIVIKVASHPNGDIYLISKYNTSLRGPSNICKLNADGWVIWSDYFQVGLNDLYVTQDGLFLAGVIDIYDFKVNNGDTIKASEYGDNIFIANCQLDGTFRWTKTFNEKGRENGPNSYYPYLSVGKDGELYVAGEFRRRMVIDEQQVEGLNNDSFLAKFNSSGECLNLISFSEVGCNALLNKNDTLCVLHDNSIHEIGTEDFTEISNIPTERSNTIFSLQNSYLLGGQQNGYLNVKCKTDKGIAWSNTIEGNTATAELIHLQNDKNDNVYSLYSCDNPINFKGKQYPKGLLLHKEDKNGLGLWTTSIPNVSLGYGATFPFYVNADNAESYLLFNFNDTINLANGEMLIPEDVSGDGNGCILHLNEIGEIDWSLPITGGIDLQSIYSDSEGNVFISGANFFNISIGNETFSSSANKCYVAKVSPDKKVQWLKTFGGLGSLGVSGTNYSLYVACDRNSDVFITGESTYDEVQLDTIDVDMSVGKGNILFAKLSPDGKPYFIKTLGNSNISGIEECTWPTGILCADNGDVFIKGWNGDSTMFDGKMLLAKGYFGFANFVACFDNDGNIKWGSNFYNKKYSYDYNQFDVDGEGNVYSAASVSDSIYFSDKYLYGVDPVGKYVNVLYKYSNVGELEWVKPFNSVGSGSARVEALCVDSDGTINYGGSFNGILQCENTMLSTIAKHAFKIKLTQEGTSVESVNEKSGIHIYPNPTTSVLNIDFDGDASIQIYNLNGQVVKTIPEFNQAGINVGDLYKGVYILQLQSKHEILREAFVVQ